MGNRRFVSLARMFHPFPSTVVAGVTVALALLADRHAEAGPYVVIGAAMLLVQFSVGITNDVVDTATDTSNKPWKAIPSGACPRVVAIVLAVGLGCTGLVLAATLRPASIPFFVLGFACGLAYDVRLKRTAWSWAPMAVALPLIPTWVYAALDEWSPWLLWAFPLGALLGLALHLANQSADVESDDVSVQGFAHALGEEQARRLATLLFGLAIAIAAGLAVFREPVFGVLIAAIGAATAFFAALAPRWLGRDAMFGVMAAGSGVVAVLFLATK